MIDRLFVYGTLQLAEITEKVVGCRFTSQPAILTGYRCGLVERADFPGIVPCLDSVVDGMLLSNVLPDQLCRLDLYEGELYQRIQALVEVDSIRHLAWVYRISPWARNRVSNTPWSIEWYRSQSNKNRFTYR